MHIAIDARMYGTKQRGIGRYLVKLIEGLEQEDEKNEYTIFLRKENFEGYQPKNPRFKKSLWDAPWYGLREQLFFKKLLDNSQFEDWKIKSQSTNHPINQSSKVNLVHFPHWNIPLFFNRPFMVTIHDLELFSSNRTRENSTRGRLTYWLKFQSFKIIFRHAVLAARAIIVPSNYVREQLLDLYPKARKKVTVIYEAPTLSPLDNSQLEDLKIQYQSSNHPIIQSLILQPFVLYVGAAYPHKNLPRLLEAWQIISKEFPDHKLVLVGREDFFWKKLKNELPHNSPQPSLNLREGDRSIPPLRLRGGRGSYETDDIIFHGEASDAELATLYKNAALLVQPSLEEGFSLSPLEALSFGCACAVSDIPVHREIYGNAVRYFDPLSSAAIAEVIKETLKDQSSNQLPREYSWAKNARATLQLYENIQIG